MMAKWKDYFAFKCEHKPEVVLEKLKDQVGLLENREYLIEDTKNGFDLGIARGGHQGGYWYCASVSEHGDGSMISGRIVYRNGNGEEIKMTWIDKIEYGCLYLVILPVALLIRIYRLFRPEVTDEELFVEFMITKMDCELLN